MKTGIELIAEERQEQILKHGYNSEHDNGHIYGEISKVAACLAVMGTDAIVVDPAGRGSEDDVWGLQSKIGHNRLKALVVAGALIAAEIDRINHPTIKN